MKKFIFTVFAVGAIVLSFSSCKNSFLDLKNKELSEKDIEMIKKMY